MANNPEAFPPTPFRFSNDEMRALQECNSESFFYRSLPFSTIFGLGAHLGVKNGYLATTKYGSAPKVALAIVAGYIIGKISYQGKCAEKIMALPDSKLGQMLRERRRAGKYTESMTLDQPELTKLFGESPPTDVYSDSRGSESAPSYMDVDTDRPQTDIDSSYWSRPDDSRMDDSLLPPPVPSRTITSYDELRRRNREDYDSNKNKYRPPGRQDSPPPAPVETVTPPSHINDTWSPPTNQYGDSWSK